MTNQSNLDTLYAQLEDVQRQIDAEQAREAEAGDADATVAATPPVDVSTGAAPDPVAMPSPEPLPAPDPVSVVTAPSDGSTSDSGANFPAGTVAATPASPAAPAPGSDTAALQAQIDMLKQQLGLQTVPGPGAVATEAGSPAETAASQHANAGAIASFQTTTTDGQTATAYIYEDGSVHFDVPDDSTDAASTPS